MSDTVWVALIIAATLVISFFIFRSRLTRLLFRYKDVEAQLTNNPIRQADSSPGGISITGNKQSGKNNTIHTTNAQGEISKNRQQGTSNEIRVNKTSS